ncbi:OmpA family protein [Hymenobacter sp. DG25A]|uniref:OmpA family protein n=1 Tax=Hymenobacter sp. DG25A TaxID=1385663 RepID=UPI0006C87036|nr:OmpA family protein [Hymenobacter sp. DG25A]
MFRALYVSLLAVLLASEVKGQSLAGVWQGAESETGQPGMAWPTVLRLQYGESKTMFGVLYQEILHDPGSSVSFQIQGTQAGTQLQITETRVLYQRFRDPDNYWCQGAVTFTYDAAEEKLTGRATYRPVGTCDFGKFTLYRIKLKSAATVPAGKPTTIHVTGREVQWYADAELNQPVNRGGTFRTSLTKTTTFYLTQGYYPTSQQTPVAVTIQVVPPKSAPKTPLAVRPPAKQPAPAAGKKLPAAAPLVTTTPVVLPKVLFFLGTAELLPAGEASLHQLVRELRARPALKIRVAGHTDQVGEDQKNLALSEKRAATVKAFLLRAGIDPARISTIGYGGAHPLFPSPDARNRRVEVEEMRD